MPVSHCEVALLRDTLMLSPQETDGPSGVGVHAEVSSGVSRKALEEASTENQVGGGVGPQGSPKRGCADPTGNSE